MERFIRDCSLFLVASGFLFSLISCEEDDSSIGIETIEISEDDLQIGIGEVHTLTVSASPEGATDGNVTWSSSDEGVAQIQFNESGLVAGVMGMGIGNAILTATPTNGGAKQTVSIRVITKVESMYYFTNT